MWKKEKKELQYKIIELKTKEEKREGKVGEESKIESYPTKNKQIQPYLICV